MSNHLDAANCSRFLKALGDPLRLRIVEFLQGGAKTVTEISEYLEIEISNASHHLHVLAYADLVMTERVGKYSYYSLASNILDPGVGNLPSSLDFGCCRLELGRRKTSRLR